MRWFSILLISSVLGFAACYPQPRPGSFNEDVGICLEFSDNCLDRMICLRAVERDWKRSHVLSNEVGCKKGK